MIPALLNLQVRVRALEVSRAHVVKFAIAQSILNVCLLAMLVLR